MLLPLVNVFSTPYEAWKTRPATLEEMMEAQNTTGQYLMYVNEHLVARVTTALEAARYIADIGADNGLGNFINMALDNSPNFSAWRAAMPSKTPPALSDYKNKYPKCDFSAVNNAIKLCGKNLPDGQVLFHAGVWPGAQKVITNRPLSTTFCPQVALRNAEHKGKAFDVGRLDLFVLRACASTPKAFAYKRKGAKLGHENEVLIAAEATLVLRCEHLVRADYTVAKFGQPAKQVPIYVLEVDLS